MLDLEVYYIDSYFERIPYIVELVKFVSSKFDLKTSLAQMLLKLSFFPIFNLTFELHVYLMTIRPLSSCTK